MRKETEALVAYILAAFCVITLLAAVLVSANIAVVVVWGLADLIF